VTRPSFELPRRDVVINPEKIGRVVFLLQRRPCGLSLFRHAGMRRVGSANLEVTRIRRIHRVDELLAILSNCGTDRVTRQLLALEAAE